MKARSPGKPPLPARSRWRRIARRVLVLLVLLFLVCCVAFVWFFWEPIHRRFVLYPRYEKRLDVLAGQLEAPPEDGWLDFRGVIHSHSYLSHDSVGTPDQIVTAAKAVGVDAIFMTDHPTPDNAQLTQALIGDVSGVLFFPGYESSSNLGVFPGEVTGELRSVVQHRPLKRLFDNVGERGGLVVYQHPEAKNRRWDLTNFQGMEIYNIHTDATEFLEDKGKMLELLVDHFFSGKRFPLIGFRFIFDEPTPFLEIWDGLNADRAVFGTAGNDAHRNTSIAVKMSATGELGLHIPAEDPEPSKSFGGLFATMGGWFADSEGMVLFRRLDPYEVSFGFVGTYLLAPERTPEAVFEALREGRGYVAFGGFLDPRGFRFDYRTGGDTFPMGATVPLGPGGKIEIRTPLDCAIRIIKDGRLLEEASNVSELKREVAESGVYRVEARIEVDGEEWPWIYSNPIRIREIRE